MEIEKIKIVFIDPCIIDDTNGLMKELILRRHRILAYAPYAKIKMKGGDEDVFI